MAKYLDQAGLQLVVQKLTNKYDQRFLGLHATADEAQKVVHKLTINVRDEESRVFDGSQDFTIDVAQASHIHPATEVTFSHTGMSDVTNVNQALDVLIKNVQIAGAALSASTANMNKLSEDLAKEVQDREAAVKGEKERAEQAELELSGRIEDLEELLEGSGNVNQAIAAVIERLAAEELRGGASLHNPDQVAGGDPTEIHAYGSGRANSALGSMWGHGRANDMHNQILEQTKGMTREEMENTHLNVHFNIHEKE